MRRLVEMDFVCKSRLRGAVATLRPARRLVGEGARAVELVSRQFVSRRLQGASVISARDAVTAEATTIEHRLQMMRRQRAVFLETGFQVHLHRVAATVTVEDLLTGQRNLHRPPEFQRQLCDDDFVIERITLAAETAAIRARDDSDARARNAERLGQGAMHIMRALRR